MRIFARLLAAIAAFAVALAGAVPFAVRIGTERVVLDAPPGLTDTTELASPRLQELAETLTSASNRIVLFALTDADARKFMTGDQIEARRYGLAVTPKIMERDRVSTEAFNAFVTDSMRVLGKPVGSDGDVLKFLDAQPRGKASLIAELRKDTAVVSVLQGSRLPQAPSGGFFSAEKPPQYLFSTTTILLLRGKLLRLDVFTGFEGPADVDWLRGITERWVGELLRLNAR